MGSGLQNNRGMPGNRVSGDMGMCLLSPKSSENGLREQGGWRRQISGTKDEGRAE